MPRPNYQREWKYYTKDNTVFKAAIFSSNFAIAFILSLSSLLNLAIREALLTEIDFEGAALRRFQVAVTANTVLNCKGFSRHALVPEGQNWWRGRGWSNRCSHVLNLVMSSAHVLDKIILPAKSSPVSFAGSDRTIVYWRRVDFTFMALQIPCCGEGVNGTGWNMTFIRSEVLVHVFSDINISGMA